MRLTRRELKRVMRYNPRTGLWFNRVTRGKGGWIKIGPTKEHINTGGHVQLCLYGKHYMSHRLAWFYMTGRWPKHDIDHKNRIKTDNRWKNLREATRSQNVANGVLKSNNRSGYKGVHWHVRLRKWHAQIRVMGKTHHLGVFDLPEHAHAAYVVAAKKHFGEFARAA